MKMPLVSCATGLLLLNGCMTEALWDRQNFYEPAPSPNLELFHSAKRQDVLVRYDELRGTEKTRRRAYFLRESESRLKERRKPIFVSVGKAKGLAPIPFLAPGTNLPPQQGLYAISNTNRYDFVLFSGPSPIGYYYLPVYQRHIDQAAKVLLTPLAVLGDATIVAVPIAFILWGEVGFPPFN